MSEQGDQRRAAWETVIGLTGVLATTQLAEDSWLATIAASALFTVGVAAFLHSGAMIVKGLGRTTRARERGTDELQT